MFSLPVLSEDEEREEELDHEDVTLTKRMGKDVTITSVGS